MLLAGAAAYLERHPPTTKYDNSPKEKDDEAEKRTGE